MTSPVMMDADSQRLILKALLESPLEMEGQFLQGSNYTFLVRLDAQGKALRAVYKPVRGERPLWDFPQRSLAKREVAAYLVSEALGWSLVPPTIYRHRKTPLGPGSLQLYIEHDPDYHYFNFSVADHQRLKPVVVLDVLLNNADRKGSHIIRAEDGHLWAIDQGLCFHTQPKLRTVIWEFAGEPIPENLLADMQRLKDELKREESILNKELIKYIRPAEINAVGQRIDQLLTARQFPVPDSRERPFPWPPV